MPHIWGGVRSPQYIAKDQDEKDSAETVAHFTRKMIDTAKTKTCS
jgi:hypothetical protein